MQSLIALLVLAPPARSGLLGRERIEREQRREEGRGLLQQGGDQAQAAQVFLTRLKMGMMLGSDVTAYYGSVAAGKSPSLTYDSPYNTLKYVGLPPSPISNVTTGSLQTVAYPATTKWLYFVAGDDGTTHFSTNLKDHEALTEKYCKKLC